MRSCLVLMIVVCLSAGLSAPAAAQRPVIAISSFEGTDGDPYSEFGEELVAYLDGLFGDRYDFRNLSSAGSTQNLERVRLQDDVYFAICQEDVASFYYSGGNAIYAKGHGGDMSVTAIARLFLEDAYLVVRPGIDRPRQIESMYVGKHLSGSYATYSSYRAYHRPIPWREVQEGDRYSLLASGEVDAVFEISTTPYPELLRFAETLELQLLRIPRNEVSLESDLYQKSVIPDSLALGGEAVDTISVPSLLLAKRTLPVEIADATLLAIMDRSLSRQVFPNTYTYLSAFIENSPRDDDALTDPRLSKLPLPPHPSVVVSTLGTFPFLDFLILALTIVLLGILAIALPHVRVSRFCYRFLRSTQRRRQFHRDVVIFICAMFWVVMACWGIKFHEIKGLISGYSLLDSAFVHMNVIDLLRWATVFSSTGYEDVGFPLVGLAKLLAVSIHLVGLALITWLGARLISFLVAGVMAGRQEMNLTGSINHVVICNWNEQGSRLVEELRDAQTPMPQRKRPIVIMSRDEQSHVFAENYTDVNHCQADPWDLEALDKVAMMRADSVIILTPPLESEEDADGIVLRTALAIKSHFKKHEKKMKSRPHVLAQLHKLQEPYVINQVGIDEFVCSGDLGSRILAQAVISPGITEFFSEILTHEDDSNEVYLVPMPEILCTGKADFWRVVEWFLKRDDQANPVLPIGLSVSRSAGEGGQEQAITVLNPPRTRLEDLGVESFSADDKVIVFADYAPTNT